MIVEKWSPSLDLGSMAGRVTSTLLMFSSSIPKRCSFIVFKYSSPRPKFKINILHICKAWLIPFLFLSSPQTNTSAENFIFVHWCSCWWEPFWNLPIDYFRPEEKHFLSAYVLHGHFDLSAPLPQKTHLGSITRKEIPITSSKLVLQVETRWAGAWNIGFSGLSSCPSNKWLAWKCSALATCQPAYVWTQV